MQPLALLVFAAFCTSALAGMLVDRAQYCTYSCRSYTSSGDPWVYSLRTSVLHCAYEAPRAADAEIVCMYSLTDGSLLADDSSERCAQVATHSCACQYGCPQSDNQIGKEAVSGMRTADSHDTITCTYAHANRCTYSTMTGALMPSSDNSHFCSRAAANSCRASAASYRGEDAQAAIQKRFQRRVVKRSAFRA